MVLRIFSCAYWWFRFFLLYWLSVYFGRNIYSNHLPIFEWAWKKYLFKPIAHFSSSSFLLFAYFFRRSLILSLSLECSGVISALCNLSLLNSSNSPASAFYVTETTGTHYHAWLIFVFLVEIGFLHVGQAGLELLALSDPPLRPPKVLGLQAWVTVLNFSFFNFHWNIIYIKLFLLKYSAWFLFPNWTLTDTLCYFINEC